MTRKHFLDFLPVNFRHEKYFLIENKILDYERICKFTDSEINNIIKSYPLCTLSNLKKIRAIAIFKKEIAISPPEAYLLLHCGVSSVKSLSKLTPYELERNIRRLERRLSARTQTKITFSRLKEWIKKAIASVETN